MFITTQERDQIESMFQAIGDAAKLSWVTVAPYLSTAGRWAYWTVFYTTAIAYGSGKAARYYYQMIRDAVGLHLSAIQDVPEEPEFPAGNLPDEDIDSTPWFVAPQTRRMKHAISLDDFGIDSEVCPIDPPTYPWEDNLEDLFSEVPVDPTIADPWENAYLHVRHLSVAEKAKLYASFSADEGEELANMGDQVAAGDLKPDEAIATVIATRKRRCKHRDIA